MKPYNITNNRIFSSDELSKIWDMPMNHKISNLELEIASNIFETFYESDLRINNILLEGDAGSGKTELAKALSYHLNLPYVKVTCFADMDKSDVFGALLPVIDSDDTKYKAIVEILEKYSIYDEVVNKISSELFIDKDSVSSYLNNLVNEIKPKEVSYKYYPSEIVNAFEHGYLLEIQEPTVIRDASVLVALNSVLEQDGILNTPFKSIKRHNDTIVVLTTNRSYQGNRPLNESLRDRMHISIKMNLPSIDIMIDRAIAKTNFNNRNLLNSMALIIKLLDETAKANNIKGVSGMRSFLYWVNDLKNNHDIIDSFYNKVLYKITTDSTEIQILLDVLNKDDLLNKLKQTSNDQLSLKQVDLSTFTVEDINSDELSLLVNKELENKDKFDVNDSKKEEVNESIESSNYNESLKSSSDKDSKLQENKDIVSVHSLADISKSGVDRKLLNKDARAILNKTIHSKSGLIIHRPKIKQEYIELINDDILKIQPVVISLVKKTLALIDQDSDVSINNNSFIGQKFNASKIVNKDFRYFTKYSNEDTRPPIAIALRIDESLSMSKGNRINSAKVSALAISLFAKYLDLPLLIYGDTADISEREKTSIYSYKEFEDDYDRGIYSLEAIKPKQNNRDGAVLKVILSKLENVEARTKIIINISDGLPKAAPNYSNQVAIDDLQDITRQAISNGIIFIAAAIGDDKEKIKNIYGASNFLNISDLDSLPNILISLISKYI
ncbi:AAA family ATPase [Mycoplasma sp. P36-A1]|uniref:AAA family ATPase n=1 Tax=Mycoplasma sp. P36-A1 TaxID=3252900 RepID=UPI003C2EDF04